MCNPAIIPIVAQAGATITGNLASTRNQAEASALNRRNAIRDMNMKVERQQALYAQQQRRAIQEGFDLALEGRANQSLAFASAATAGVSGISINSLIADIGGKTARGLARIDKEQADRKEQYALDSAAILATTNSRINAVQPPSMFGTIAQLIDPAMAGVLSGVGLIPEGGGSDNAMDIATSYGDWSGPSYGGSSGQYGGNYGATRSGAAGDGLRG